MSWCWYIVTNWRLWELNTSVLARDASNRIQELTIFVIHKGGLGFPLCHGLLALRKKPMYRRINRLWMGDWSRIGGTETNWWFASGELRWSHRWMQRVQKSLAKSDGKRRDCEDGRVVGKSLTQCLPEPAKALDVLEHIALIIDLLGRTETLRTFFSGIANLFFSFGIGALSLPEQEVRYSTICNTH